MGHDSERAAVIYQREARSADSSSRTRSMPTSKASSREGTATRTDQAGPWSPHADGALMARKISNDCRGLVRWTFQTGSDLGS